MHVLEAGSKHHAGECCILPIFRGPFYSKTRSVSHLMDSLCEHHPLSG